MFVTESLDAKNVSLEGTSLNRKWGTNFERKSNQLINQNNLFPNILHTTYDSFTCLQYFFILLVYSWVLLTGVYLEPSRTSTMDQFCLIIL